MTFFWKALSVWPRNCWKSVKRKQKCRLLFACDQRHSLSKTNPDATNWGKSTGNWGASWWLAAKLISSAGSQSTSTDFHNCQISTKGENGPNRFFRDLSMAALLALFSGFSQALVGVILYCFTSFLSDLSPNVVYHCNFFARDLERQRNWDLMGFRGAATWDI